MSQTQSIVEAQRSRLVMQLTFVATLGGLLFGYDTAVISGAVSSIDAYFIDPRHLSETARSTLSGFANASAIIGCIIGAPLAGWLSSSYGRKGGLLFAGALFLFGSVGSAVPEFGFGTIGEMGPHALTQFIVYRIVGGIGVGVASMLSPLYIAEIAPSDIRGKLISFNQLAIVGGMLIVYFVNLMIARQGDDAWLHSMGWRWMFASEAVPSIIFMALLAFVPDTPRWYVLRGREERALTELRRLTNESDALSILGDIKRTLVAKSEPLFTFGALVIVVGILISVFQQFVGINAVLYYAPLMFSNMGASTDSSLLQTLVVGAANMAFTVVAILTVDRWGRRPLLILGALIMAVAMLSLGFLFNAKAMGLGALIAVIVYIAGFALSWGPVAWVVLAEMFPNSIKSKGLAIAVGAQWVANWMVSTSFKVIDGNSALNAMFNHGFAYWIYGVMSVLAALFVMRYVPETKGRSLESIQDLWHKGSRVPASTPEAATAKQ
jgi:MFS transporter, SP family, xylose:H+ symportor